MNARNEERALLLGREKIGKLLMKFALPAVVAQISSSLYNVVDRIFIGQGVGAMAISGLALTFPFMNLAAAFGALVGVGASTMISIKLGEKDYKTARLVLGNVIILNILFGVGFTVLCFPFLDSLLYALGGSPETVPYAKDYMTIILFGNVFTHLYLGLNSVLRSSGYPEKAMWVTIVSVATNAVLDVLFIFGFKMGISGAALATVITQAMSTLVLLFMLLKRNKVVYITRESLHLKRKIVAQSCAIGLSPFATNLVGCLIVIVYNLNLQKYGGDLAIGAYGIINSIAFMVFMVVLGITQGMQPIVGYNYGAKNYKRALQCLKLSMLCGLVVASVGFLLAELAPEFMARAFTSDKSLIDLTVVGFRIVMIVFPLVGLQVVASNFFQSIGLVKKAIFLSLTRQLIFLFPALMIFPLIMGLNGIWFAAPFSDTAAFVVTMLMLRKLIRKMENNPAFHSDK
ncbi:MAG: MATE family efflux transporter [Bacteroidales bacterium]|nr:MATE family efflux transporter [Bacteroidales bacterium]